MCNERPGSRVEMWGPVRFPRTQTKELRRSKGLKQCLAIEVGDRRVARLRSAAARAEDRALLGSNSSAGPGAKTRRGGEGVALASSPF
jgi:hypothetical protein